MPLSIRSSVTNRPANATMAICLCQPLFDSRSSHAGMMPRRVPFGFSFAAWGMGRTQDETSVLLEFARNQFSDRFERGIRIRSVHADDNHRSVTGSEHHQAHDALSIHFFTVFLHEDFGLETVRRFDELCGGPGVDAEFVEDREFFLNHGEAVRAGETVETPEWVSKVKAAKSSGPEENSR